MSAEPRPWHGKAGLTTYGSDPTTFALCFSLIQHFSGSSVSFQGKEQIRKMDQQLRYFKEVLFLTSFPSRNQKHIEEDKAGLSGAYQFLFKISKYRQRQKLITIWQVKRTNATA